MTDPLEYDDVFLAMQQFMDAVGGPDRVCGYCGHPRSSEFCRTSHPYGAHDVLQGRV